MTPSPAAPRLRLDGLLRRLGELHALAAGALDGRARRAREGVRLDREAGRHGDVARRADDLDDVVLLLGHLAGSQEAREVHLGVRVAASELLELDEREDLVLVARARRAAHELGQPPVERRLAALEAGAHGPARARLLAAHAEAAGRALAGGDAAALAHLAFRRARRRLDVVDAELRRSYRGILGGLSPLPVIQLHLHGRLHRLAEDRRRVRAALADKGSGEPGRR